jgi:cell division protease FtsH
VSASHRTTSARPGPPKDRAPTPAPPPPPNWRRWVVPTGISIAFVAVLFFNPVTKKTSAQNLSYTAFVNEVTTDKVSIGAKGHIRLRREEVLGGLIDEYRPAA